MLRNIPGSDLGVAKMDIRRATQFLLEQIQKAYLQRSGTTDLNAPDLRFRSNQDFWEQVLLDPHFGLRWVELTDFKIVDWFPRSPGLFHTFVAKEARWEAEHYIVEENGIRFYAPNGKMHMIEGGTGSVRFKPVRIDNEDCWLCTATSDGLCHSGIPLAVPNHVMQQIETDFHRQYRVMGQVKFLPTFLSEDYFYHMRRVPQMYVFVDNVELLGKEDHAFPVNITPMVFFTGDIEYPNRLGYELDKPAGNVTYVTCRADKLDEIDKAAEWLAWYADRYRGKIITNFDEQRSAFCDAPFSLQNVMSGRLDKYQMRNFNIRNAEIICNTVQRIHSEAITMTQIEVKLGNDVTIHGDFVVASSIKDSFNKVSESSAPDELKDLLKKLTAAVGKMTEQMPKETAQEVARDLDTLVAEATSPAPRKQWWQLSIDELKKAAQDIGEIGKPVLELARLLVPLLLNMSA